MSNNSDSKIKAAYMNIQPSDEQKDRMLNNILAASSDDAENERDNNMNVNKAHKRNIRKILLAAAIITVLATLSIAAYANGWLHLNDVRLAPESESGNEAQTAAENYAISLQGFQNSPEFKAADEWYSYSNDPDNPIEVDNSFIPEAKYREYFVCNDEMCKKLDEICEKYKLSLHAESTDFYSNEDRTQLYRDLKIGKLFTERFDNSIKQTSGFTGYRFSDGTMHLDCDIYDPEIFKETFTFQMRRCMKGTFDEVTIWIDDASQYTQWDYITESGAAVTLALCPQRALIMADFPKSTVYINLVNMEYPASTSFLTAQQLELFTSLFDFTQIP